MRSLESLALQVEEELSFVPLRDRDPAAQGGKKAPTSRRLDCRTVQQLVPARTKDNDFHYIAHAPDLYAQDDAPLQPEPAGAARVTRHALREIDQDGPTRGPGGGNRIASHLP